MDLNPSNYYVQFDQQSVRPQLLHPLGGQNENELIGYRKIDSSTGILNKLKHFGHEAPQFNGDYNDNAIVNLSPQSYRYTKNQAEFNFDCPITRPVDRTRTTDTSQQTRIVAAPSPSSKKNWPIVNQRSNLVSIKSRIGVEVRRYAVDKNEIIKFDDLYRKVESMHALAGTPFSVNYFDRDGELLPINNDGNLAKAIRASGCLKTTHFIVANINNPQYHNSPHGYQPTQRQQPRQINTERPYLKLVLETRQLPSNAFSLGQSSLTMRSKKKDNLINMFIPSSGSTSDSRPLIGKPWDFRQVSSIIDADILPATRRRVVLKRGGSDKPLGFYIRDGTYYRDNEINYGIFISRLVPGGLAESTNLLAVDDQILEVNGIEVGKGKSLDQVRDMMIVNSNNLIITTRPARPYAQPSANRARGKNGINHTSHKERFAPVPQYFLTGNICSPSHYPAGDMVRHYMH